MGGGGKARMSEHMDVRVRAGPPTARSAGYRNGFIVPASVRRNGLWLLSAETESDSRAQRTKALDLFLIFLRGERLRLRDAWNGIARRRERPKQERRAGLLSEAWMAELSNGAHAPGAPKHSHD